MIFGYLSCVVSALVVGLLTWGLGMFSAPLWVQIIIGGAVAPICLLAAFIYLGGLYHAWIKIVGEGKKKEKKDD